MKNNTYAGSVPALDLDALKSALAARVATLAPQLLPNGKKEGGFWVCGDVSGAKGRSFKINLSGPKAGMCKDFGSGDKAGTLIDVVMGVKGYDTATAIAHCAELVGMTSATTTATNGKHAELAKAFNWKPCQDALTSDKVQRFADWRGLPPAFCEKLRDDGLLGFHKGGIAVPVDDQHGVRVGVQYFPKGSRGFYEAGGLAHPFIIGQIRTATRVFCFESQWDGLAYYERRGLGTTEAIISTRGVDHAKKLAGRIPESAELIVFRQNDEPDSKGEIADEKWFMMVLETLERPMKSVRVPCHLKDLNDWTKDGATSADILSAIEGADTVGNPVHAEKFMDPQSELVVLGSLIRSNDVLLEFSGELSPDYFASKRGALIFGAVSNLVSKRHPINAISVTRELESINGASETVGGFHGISGLAALESMPAITHEVTRLRELALSREIVQTARQLAALENSGNPLDGLARLSANVDRLRDKQRSIKPGVLPPMIGAFSLITNPPPTPPELIVGVLYQTLKLTLGGASKSNKTWSLIDMALSVATGMDWWGFPTVQGRVVYLNLEVPAFAFEKRVKFVADAKAIPITAALEKDLRIWNLRGHSAPLALLGPKIIEEIKRMGDVSLIILDPMYKLTPGEDENGTAEMGKLCVELDKLATETGAAIAYGAHFSKGNQSQKESIDRISGSGVLARDPDAIVTITKHEEEGAFTVDPILRCHAPVEPFVVRWNFPLFTRDAGLDPSKLKKAKTGREATYSDDDLLEHLKDGAEMAVGEWQRAVKEECGMSEGSFHAKRRSLQAAKKIRKSPISGKWCLK